MARKFDVSDLTLNAQEVTEASKLIVEKGFETGLISEVHDVQTGISFKQQIIFLSRMGVGGKKLTACTPAELEALKFTEKFWEPDLVAGRMTFCANDENRLFKILSKWENVYPEFFELIPDDVMAIVVSLLLEHITESVLAKAWFSNTVASSFTDGGDFTDGTDLDVYNQIDGIFKQIFADSTIPHFEVAKNGGADYAAQKVTPDEAYAIIEGVVDNADSRLLSQPDAFILVTSDVYRGYVKKVMETEKSGGNTNVMINGLQTAEYAGYKVINMDIWTRQIIDVKNDGTKYFKPNRAVMTTKENIPIGTLSKDDLQNLRTIFDEKDNEVIIDYGYFLDAKLGEGYMTSVAY